MNETEAADGYIVGFWNVLAVAQRDLRVAQNKITTLEKENKQLSGSVEVRDAVIRDLRKALVGEMANLDRPAYTPTATPPKDPELAAIEQVLGILSRIEAEMGNAVSKRVLQYINNRHGY